MPQITADEFLGRLESSNLLNDEQLAWVRKAAKFYGTQPKQLIKRVVEHGLLTRWQAQQLVAGQVNLCLGRYRLLDRIGVGGMGVVFKAEHSTMGRVVALKKMATKFMSQPDAVARFRREVQLAASLHHPNIVTAYDADQIGDTHFLVMEYVDGNSLDAWLKQYGTLPIDWACECARQVAIGLDYANRTGLVHRDISPKNVLVVNDATGAAPRVKILDFGLARLEAKTGEQDSEINQLMGTPDYIAPEQARDCRTADVRSDIYSLGCTLFHLLTGQPPFSGTTPMEKIHARLGHEAPLLRSLRSDVPMGLELVVARMLAGDPEQRYQTAKEASEALAPYAAGTAAAEAAPVVPIHLELERQEPEVVAEEADTALSEFFNQLSNQVVVLPAPPLGQIEPAPSIEAVPQFVQDRPIARTTARPKVALKRRRSPLPWILVALGIVGVAAVAGVMVMRPKQATLRLELPESERAGVEFRIDNQPVTMAAQGRLDFPLPAGEHAISLQRRFYQPIQESLKLEAGKVLVYRPEWKRAHVFFPEK